MRSYHLESAGSLDGIVQREDLDPEPGPNEVLVRIHASSLNYRDIAIARGFYGGRPPRPGVIPLSDGAGEVVAVGKRVTGYVSGDRVAGIFRQSWLGGSLPPRAVESDLGCSRDGMLAEMIALNEEGLVKIPSHLDYQEAATLPCAAVTAWHAIHAGDCLQPGQTMLILGSGGVSLFALQIATRMGARVIAITSSNSKAARLKELGASEVINYAAEPDWDREVLRLTGGMGVDRVIETGGSGTLARSLGSSAVEGHVILIGVLAGQANIDPLPILLRRLTVKAISTGSRDMFESLNRAICRWQLRPVIDRVFGFDAAIAAYRHLESQNHVGKVVIDLSQ